MHGFVLGACVLLFAQAPELRQAYEESVLAEEILDLGGHVVRLRLVQRKSEENVVKTSDLRLEWSTREEENVPWSVCWESHDEYTGRMPVVGVGIGSDPGTGLAYVCISSWGVTPSFKLQLLRFDLKSKQIDVLPPYGGVGYPLEEHCHRWVGITLFFQGDRLLVHARCAHPKDTGVHTPRVFLYDTSEERWSIARLLFGGSSEKISIEPGSLEEKLATRILQYRVPKPDTTLRDLLWIFGRAYEINFALDVRVKNISIKPARQGLPLAEGLTELLRPYRLGYVVRRDVVLIVRLADIEQYAKTK